MSSSSTVTCCDFVKVKGCSCGEGRPLIGAADGSWAADFTVPACGCSQQSGESGFSEELQGPYARHPFCHKPSPLLPALYPVKENSRSVPDSHDVTGRFRTNEVSKAAPRPISSTTLSGAGAQSDSTVWTTAHSGRRRKKGLQTVRLSQTERFPGEETVRQEASASPGPRE